MILAGHKLHKLTQQDLLRHAYRLRRKSLRLVPVSVLDLQEGEEICIDGKWYEIFLVDHVNNEYYLERGTEDGK